jgi:hypothetical protein
MELEKKNRLLQTIYAGALVDSIQQFSQEGILKKVESRKKDEQMLSGKMRAAQFGITQPEDVFHRLADIFGCANWDVQHFDNGFTAVATNCMLCAFAKKIGTPSLCNLYCLDPMEGMIKGVDPNLQYKVETTLWNNNECSVKVFK